MSQTNEVANRSEWILDWGLEFAAPYRSTKGLLVFGFLATIAAIYIAHNDPANGYEVSIYLGTPTAFWLLTLLALVIGTGIAIYQVGTSTGKLGLLLSATSVVSVVSLPLIRGYYYYGLTDGLNHLGFTRKVATGIRSYFSLIYPGGHSTAIFFDAVTGIGIPRALFLVVVVCSLAFVVFVPLTVNELVNRPRPVYLAVFVALFFMPINNVSTTPQFHPFTLATLLTPFVFYLLFKHLRYGAEDDALPARISAASLVLLPATVGVLLYHPQVLFNVLVIFVVIAFLQLGFRLRGIDNVISRSRPVYGLAVFLVVAFYFWNTKHWQASATVERTISALDGFVRGTNEAAPNLRSRQRSADALGVSFPELFFKLFLVEALFALVAISLVVSNFLDKRPFRDEVDLAVAYFTFSGIVLLPYFFTQMIGDIAHNFFRHVGFAMVVVTILAPIALYRWWDDVRLREYLRPLLVVILVVSIVISSATLFPSPFIYLYNHQASEHHMAGFEDTFRYQPAEPERKLHIGTVGLVFSRYERALAGKPGTPWYPGLVKPFPSGSGPIPDDGLLDLPKYYATHPEPSVRRDHYVVVTSVDRKRAVEAYGELRYSERSFRRIQTQDNVHLVHTNGEFNAYYVDLPPPAGSLYNASSG